MLIHHKTLGRHFKQESASFFGFIHWDGPVAHTIYVMQTLWKRQQGAWKTGNSQRDYALLCLINVLQIRKAITEKKKKLEKDGNNT